MKFVKTFEQFELNDTESLNEEVKLFGKEIKLWPSYNDVLRNKLSFIMESDVDNLKAGSQQREIKDLMLKVDKATKTSKNSLRDLIEEAQVQGVQSMLKSLKELKADLMSDDKIIGYISYFPEDKKFYYNPGFAFQKG
jgi:hypothetical protein